MPILTKRISRDSSDLDLHVVGSVEGAETIDEVIFDPATVSECATAKVLGIFHSIQSDLVAMLKWEHEGGDTLMVPLEGRGVLTLNAFGGLENPAVPGCTGRIILTVWAPRGGDATRHFAISLDLTKQRRLRDATAS